MPFFVRIKHKENIFRESKDLNFSLIDKDINSEMNIVSSNDSTLRFYHIIMAFKNNLFYHRERKINVENRGRLV